MLKIENQKFNLKSVYSSSKLLSWMQSMPYLILLECGTKSCQLSPGNDMQGSKKTRNISQQCHRKGERNYE